MKPRALYSVCVGACTHLNEANRMVKGALRVTFPVEIPIPSLAMTDDRSAGLELLGKRVQRCRCLPSVALPSLLNGTQVSQTLHGTSSCYAHVPVDGDAAKAVGSRTPIMKGIECLLDRASL